MSDTNQNYLNVPVSQECIQHFNNYIKITGVDPSKALEWAINRLTSLYWADEGFPKKAICHVICNESYLCWVLGEYIEKYSGIKMYRIAERGQVLDINATAIEFIDES